MKRQSVYISEFILLLSLSACSDTSNFDNQQRTIEQLSSEIEELSETVSSLQEQFNALQNKTNSPNVIYPTNYEDTLLYVNSAMPLAISLVNADDLPIKVYGYDGRIEIFYEDENTIQFLEGYGIVPRILIFDNNENPEYHNTKSIVKVIDDNWAIVEIISIETSLDGPTNQKIRTMLDSIKFY